MRPRPLMWFAISLLCLAAAWFCWQWGDRMAARKQAVPPAQTNAAFHLTSLAQFKPASPVRSPILPMQEINQPGQTNLTPAEVAAIARTNRLKLRLSNTTRSIGELVGVDTAVLLENALIDTASGQKLSIPDELRSHGDPGAYIVQSRGPLNDAFRAMLREAGAEIVSYVPNNAYLVRASESAAGQLAGQLLTQSVLPFEPYYKLKADLLAMAVKHEDLSADTPLNLLLFADKQADTLTRLQDMGVRVVGRSTSPFGTVVQVQAPADSLAGLAGLTGVQSVEQSYRRQQANDLTRILLRIARDPVTNVNYLDLDGTNVIVAVADGGVATNHPDLLPPRVIGEWLGDTDGHGTHVAGIIAANTPVPDTDSPTNAVGSVTNASFRGMAPGATIFSLNYQDDDGYLQQQAARTNAFISNNSWSYANDYQYDLAAACYDAAVRDALPDVTGSQPLVFVFVAGNSGSGDDDGLGGIPDTITSPGTAKNVITVGATELPRYITNRFAVNGVTNDYFKPWTDSSNQVAFYSSRGNVGIQIEGEFGRFKPDVVAPGSFVVSTRSPQWDTNAYYNPTNYYYALLQGLQIEPGSRFDDLASIPANAVSFGITVVTNPSSANPFPSLPIYARKGQIPDVTDDTLYRGTNDVTITFPPDENDGTWFYTIRNLTTETVLFDVLLTLTTTNTSNELEALNQLNESLTNQIVSQPPLYRYESGTSMAAASVSGFLALVQQYCETNVGRPSPALMKAMLINGSRSIGSLYDFQVQTTVNNQGWGMPNLTNTLPAVLNNRSNLIAYYTNYVSHPPGPIQIYDQDSTNSLATGQSFTRYFQLNNAARNDGKLQFTLVWTDPPGNPVAGVKLVNDLDLVVTNLATGVVYYGNDIAAGAIATTAHSPTATVAPDSVNNVENIYLNAASGSALSGQYAVTVIGRRVNVNAVTAHTNSVVQDYALIISSGNLRTNNHITVTNTAFFESSTNVLINDKITNGVPLIGERVGASSPLIGTNAVDLGSAGYSNAVLTVGMTNQWHFYIFTNYFTLTNANFTNIAFATFLSTTLADPRGGVLQNDTSDPTANATREEADIDLYVSTNSAITNLDLTALLEADKSLERGGTETIIYQYDSTDPNNQPPPPGQVYYVGVKSEDRQAAEYGFFAIATDQPFSEDFNGGTIVHGFTVPQAIPDGTLRKPGKAYIFGFTLSQGKVRRAVVTNSLQHELFGDLYGVLTHQRQQAILNNHAGGSDLTTNYNFIYEDNNEGDISAPNLSFTPKHSDGPGTLRNFVGERMGPQWLFTMADNSPFFSGQEIQFDIRLERMPPIGDDGGLFEACLEPGQYYYIAFDVPVATTNLIVGLTNSDPGSLIMFIKRAVWPNLTNNDKLVTIDPPGGQLTVGLEDYPPLQPDRYYLGIYNPIVNGTKCFTGQIVFQKKATGETPNISYSFGSEDQWDDALTNSAINVETTSNRVVSVEVGMRINHPRISDLALTLVSPDGTRVLLMENRGGLSTNGTGVTLATSTNLFPTATNGTYTANSNVLAAGANQGILLIDYDFQNISDNLRVYYDGGSIFESGLVSGTGQFRVPYGPGSSTDLTIVMNEGDNSDTNSVWSYTASVISQTYSYLVFTEDTNKTTIPIKFAVLPFNGGETATTIFTNSFELSGSVGAHVQGDVFDGWTVLTNQVTVTNDAAGADTGSQYLALEEGAVQRDVPTTIGKNYSLNYAHRQNYLSGLIGWWKGESNMVDSFDGHDGQAPASASNAGPQYTSGMAGTAFRVFGTNAVEVPFTSDLISPTYTMEAWVFVTDLAANLEQQGAIFGQLYGLGGIYARNDGAGIRARYIFDNPSVSRYCDGTTVFPLNTWHHVAATWDGTTMRIYTDGVLENSVVPAPPLTTPVLTDTCPFYIGGYFACGSVGFPTQFMRGVVDEVGFYRRALTSNEIKAIYNAGADGKCGMQAPPPPCLPSAFAQVSASLSTNVVGGTTNWHYTRQTFTATEAATPITFVGINSNVYLDSISVEELPGDVYYLPEESLSAFKGQDPNGAWRLELWDNRAGAPAPAGSLESWWLNFVFENQTSSYVFSNTVPAGSITNLLIHVPCYAVFASNVLLTATGPVNVYFNQIDPVTGTGPGDILMLPGATNGSFVLTSFSVPPLEPCRDYYIGIENTNSTSISFIFKVVFGLTYPFPAFPGAEGAGLGAFGGRTGDVYHVTSLADSGPGTLRDGVTNGNRTIVFDIGGYIDLLSELQITNSKLTIAGQTAPGDGVTLRGYSMSLDNVHDIVLRFLRFRPGDIYCATTDGYALRFGNVSNCIVDHVSASWSLRDALTVTNSTNVTIQWSLIAESLRTSCRTNLPHGLGTTVRYGNSQVSLHHNLYANNNSANPWIGDNLSVDFVNNVLFNWGELPGYSQDDIFDNPGGFTNQLNYIKNAVISSTNPTDPTIAFNAGSLNTWIYQAENLISTNPVPGFNGVDTGWNLFAGLYTQLNDPFPIWQATTYSTTEAYERVLDFVGAWQNRDAVDQRIVAEVRSGVGTIIDSQTDVGDWPVLNSATIPVDSDQDGMPDYYEYTLGLDPLLISNREDRDTNGYTDLEEYLDWLAVPHASTLSNTPVDVDLLVMAGQTGNLSFAVTDGTNGTVILQPDGHTATFTPTQDYTGFASFGFFVTNNDTLNSFGPVTERILVSSVEPTNSFRPEIIRVEVITNSFCLTWTSIIGVEYAVQGEPALNVGNWVFVSPTITAVDTNTTYCIPLPSTNNFFRVIAYPVGNDFVVPEEPAVPPEISSITYTNGGFLFQWTASTSLQFTAQWTTNLTAPVAWSTFPVVITSTNGIFSFFDDGSLTSGFGPVRFYRLQIYP